MKRSDNEVKEKLHTQVYARPSVFFIQLLLDVTLKGKKWDEATRDDHCEG